MSYRNALHKHALKPEGRAGGRGAGGGSLRKHITAAMQGAARGGGLSDRLVKNPNLGDTLAVSSF